MKEFLAQARQRSGTQQQEQRGPTSTQAGVSIPRNTYQPWAALPHIAVSAIEPGDPLFYDGIGHVARYVGNGQTIDAPRTGLTVERLPMNISCYASTFVGAARP